MKNLIFASIISMLGAFSLCAAQQSGGVNVSVSFGIGYFGSPSSGLYGEDASISFVDEADAQSQVNLSGDIALRLDGYIFSFYMAKGLVDPIRYKQANYSEYNITVGKEFIKTKWFGLEGHLGFGLFNYEEVFSDFEEVRSDGNIGFPLRIKANVYLGKHFAIGVNPNFNFNFSASVMGIALTAQLEL